MATADQETFEDIDLEDAHTSRINPPTQNAHHYYPVPAKVTFMTKLMQPIQPILPLLIKLKNIILMIPAMFIFCVVLFVCYCTLFLALPHRIKTSSQHSNALSLIMSICIGVLFILTAIITISSFIRCVFTSSEVRNNPPSVSAANINTETCRRCIKCKEFKPPRAHHCSICGSCVLKMDHHCPWVSNCVGYYNYKYFCLFIWFATLSCHLSSLMGFSQLFSFLDADNDGINSNGFHRSNGYSGPHSSWVMINSLLSLAFGVTLTCFGSFHLFLVLSGATTIEMGSNEYKQFDLGRKGNFYAIFGENCLFWFIPIPTMSGDGYEFVNGDQEERQLLDDQIYDDDENGIDTESLTDLSV